LTEEQVVLDPEAYISHKNERQRTLNAQHYYMTVAGNASDPRFQDIATEICEILTEYLSGTWRERISAIGLALKPYNQHF
jgi:hypothetical protein